MESNPGLGGVVDDMTLKSTPAVDIVDLTHEENEVAAKEGLLHSLEHHDLGADISPSDLEGASVDDTDDNENEVWETESLYEDALEGLGDDQLLVDHHVDSCTLDEAVAFRKRLRLIGDEAFVAETIEARVITAKKLCTAFGIRPPQFLEGAPDHAYYPLLSLGISRELSKREKLPEYNTIDDAVELLQKSKNIIVLTGAGISTSLGIPDFRSKDTGLYSKLEYLGLSDPQEVFDIDLFREDPSIFYSIAKDILPETNKFSPTHAFIRLLETKGKLLTNFTQNIDNLEGHAGISPEKLIQCHGSFATASCVKCRHQVPGTEIYPELKAGQVARCLRCLQQMREDGGTGLKRKRSLSRSSSRDPCKHRRWSNQSSDDDEGDYDIPEAGVMKPDITFFGEDLPETFHRRLVNHDSALVDLVVVIGTSLKVAPVSEVIGFLPPETPQIYISRTPVSHVNFDVDMLGDCDIVVAELCRRAGWDLRHEMIPAAQRIAVEPIPGYASRWLFRVEQPAAEADAQEREG